MLKTTQTATPLAEAKLNWLILFVHFTAGRRYDP
jgi:hypothetical protein